MQSLIRHISTTKGLWRIILLIFAFQFILASTVGLQMQQVLDASIGRSLSVEKLNEGFSFTVFQDFINVHGGSFSVLYGQMRWMVLTYLIIASFISTGLIFILGKGEKSITSFFSGGVNYFFKFFFLDIIFLIIIGALTGAGLITILSLFEKAPLEFDTELVFLRWTLFIVILLFLLISIFTTIKVLIKFDHVNNDHGLFTSVKRGFSRFWRHKWKLIGWASFFFITSILLSVINYAFGDLPLLPMIIGVQAIMLFKIFWRVVFYKVLGHQD